MSSAIPVLWSDDISVDVLSPLAILRAQAGPLSQKTKGILEVGIDTITSKSGRVQHQFDLVAPALNNYRRRILLATHQKDLVYPIVVDADCFVPETKEVPLTEMIDSISKMTISNKLPEQQRRAATDREFIELVSEVLRSYQVRSLIQSLIARSNDQNMELNSTTEPEESLE